MFYVICGGVIAVAGFVTVFGLIAYLAWNDPHERALHRPRIPINRA